METISELLRSWNQFLEPYPALQALEIIVAFLVLAALSDRLITGIVSRMASRTVTDLDDRILKALHRPVFTSVALVGLILAAYHLDLGEQVLGTATAMVKTVLILIWLVFGLRFIRLMLGAAKLRASPTIPAEATSPVT